MQAPVFSAANILVAELKVRALRAPPSSFLRDPQRSPCSLCLQWLDPPKLSVSPRRVFSASPWRAFSAAQWLPGRTDSVADNISISTAPCEPDGVSTAMSVATGWRQVVERHVRIVMSRADAGSHEDQRNVCVVGVRRAVRRPARGAHPVRLEDDLEIA